MPHKAETSFLPFSILFSIYNSFFADDICHLILVMNYIITEFTHKFTGFSPDNRFLFFGKYGYKNQKNSKI